MERQPIAIVKSRPVLEGAGVRLRRAFGFGDPSAHDPFLLLDDFRASRREDFIRGFPWHPHRGIETITYMLRGRVEHADSLGNRGVIGAGDVQWMTAGSGIIHQEMPLDEGDGRMEGFQLWTNLPAARKLMRPRYQEVAAPHIPEATLADGSRVRVVAGRWGQVQGPVEDIETQPDFFDLELAPGADLRHPIPLRKNAFAYVFGGRGRLGEGQVVEDGTLVDLGDGEEVRLRSVDPDQPFRLLLCTGMRLGEPVAWQGPIVMNTRDQLLEAFREMEEGTFLKG